MAMAEKVVGLNPNKVYGAIRSFLNEKSLNSENTRIAYEDDITLFFAFTRNKVIADLTREDLNYTYDEVLNFKLFLADKYKSGNSINRKLATIRKLFKILGRTFDDLKQNAFQVDNVKAVTEHYGVLTLDECRQMIQKAEKQRKGKEKSVLIHMAVMTSIRLDALLNIKWSDIRRVDDMWLLSAIDKGRTPVTMPMHDVLYEHIMELWTPECDKNDHVFSLNPKTCSVMVKYLTNELGIDELRNVTFHSFRKVAPTWSLRYQNDIMIAARQCNHKSPATTLNSYIPQHTDYHNMPGMLMEENPDTTTLEELSKEQLLSLIDSAGYDVKMKLIMAAKKSVR